MINPERSHLVQGSHWVSPVNFDPEVTRSLDFPSPLGLISSTLRKVRYTAGATTTTDGFLRIAAALDEVGIRDESLNLDWWGDEEPNRGELELVREILAGGFSFTANVYADTLLGDGTKASGGKRTVDLLLELGARVIAPGIVAAPTAEAQARQFGQLADVVEYAHGCGLGVTVTLAQAGRRDFTRMLEAANEAVALGVTRIDLMDSTSSLSPEAMAVFVRRFRAGLHRPVPLTMHVHDDFGLGTAAAIAAAGAGAGPDVSVNGASYRCGFPPLEEVVTSLEVLYGVDTGIAVDKLQWISDLVAREMGLPNPALKPVTGGYAFLKHTPGDVLSALANGVDAFPPISGCVHASVTGAPARWVWDSLSTPAMARQLAINLGLDLDEAGLRALRADLDAAVAAIEEYPRWLDQAQVEAIARQTEARAPRPRPVQVTGETGG
jgi:D-citramalate synthase